MPGLNEVSPPEDDYDMAQPKEPMVKPYATVTGDELEQIVSPPNWSQE